MAKNVIAMLSLHSSPLGRLGERDTGGMSVYLLEVSTGLGGKGYGVDIFTLEAGLSEARVEWLAENVRLIFLPYRWGKTVKKEELHDHLGGVFKEFLHFNNNDGRDYSAVHSHYWLSACVGRLISKRFGIPHLVSFHTVGAIKNGACREESEPEIRLKWEPILAAECDRVIVSTEDDRRRLALLYGMPEEGIGVAPCGVNLGRFKPVPKDTARKRLGFENGMTILLAVGRYVAIKGMDRLLEAVSVLAQEDNVLFLLVGGDGPESLQFRTIARKAEELGITRNTIQAGRVDQDDLCLYYSAADVFLVGSYYESFCLTALEALACGTPVIGSAVGCLPEVVGSGAGMVLDDADGPNLAAAVETFLTIAPEERLPPSRLRELASSCSWDRTVKALARQYDDVYDDVFQKAGGRFLE